MQSFYGNFVVKDSTETPSALPATYSSGGSRSSSCPPSRFAAEGARGPKQLSFYHDSFWSKPRFVPPPIFRAGGRRSEEALALDRQVRSAETLQALMAVVSPAIARFDVGNVIIALASCARVADERTLPTLKFGYPAFHTLQARARESLGMLEPRGVAMLAHSAAKLGWKDLGFLTALAGCATSKAEDLGTTDLAKICWAFSKLDAVDEFPSFWQAMSEHVRMKICTAKSVDLSMLAWAFGNSGQGDPGLCVEMAKSALQLMAELTPQCLANIAWAMARLSEPHEELCNAIVAKSMTLIADFVDFDVTHLCWALAKLESADVELFDLLADHTVNSDFVRRFSAQMASQLAWAFAAARVAHRPLFDQLASFVVRHASVLEPQHLANCAWAFACVELQDPNLVHALTYACKGGKLWTFQPDEFCAIAWAFTKFHTADAEIQQDLLVIARQRFDEVDNVSFVNLLTSLLAMTDAHKPVNGDATLAQLERREIARQLVEQLESVLEKRDALNAQQLAAICRALARSGFQEDARRIATDSSEPRVWAALLTTAERGHHAAWCVELWSRLAGAAPAGALRAAALYAAAKWASDAQLPDSQRRIDELCSLPPPLNALCELLGGMPLSPEGAVHAEKEAPEADCWSPASERAELAGLLLSVLETRAAGNPAKTLQAAEAYGTGCRELDVSLGSRDAILDEFTARLPHLVVEIGGGCGSVALHIAARVQEYGGRVVSIESDPFCVAVSRCIADFAGLSSSLQLLPGESADCLPQLLESRGPSSVDVLLLRGNKEGQYLSELRRVEDLGLFTSGCVVADHMLQFGSPQFLADMSRSRKYSLELVEVELAGRGLDWVALCAVRACLQDEPPPERELPSGLASLRAGAEEAWKQRRNGRVPGSRKFSAERFREKLADFARNLGVEPSKRLLGADVAPLPESSKDTVRRAQLANSASPTEISLAQHEPRTDAKAAAPEPDMGPASRSPVAQQYVRALDMKRWLTAVDPTGGCLHYLSAAQESYESSDLLTKAYVQESEGHRMLKADFFSDLAIAEVHRPRFLRWLTDSCGVERVLGPGTPAAGGVLSGEGPMLPCSQAASKEDSAIDMRHLTFSDWLASMDAAMTLQQYLPVIQDSYDTVSQIAATYTIVRSDEPNTKCLDEQIFEDFGVEDPDHRALFRSWFVRFCGVRHTDESLEVEEEDGTPHFGPEGGRGDLSQALEAKAELSCSEATQTAEGSPEIRRASGGCFFDFEDLPESSPTSPKVEQEANLSLPPESSGVSKVEHRPASSCMFDFDRLDEAQHIQEASTSPGEPEESQPAQRETREEEEEAMPAPEAAAQEDLEEAAASATPTFEQKKEEEEEPDRAMSLQGIPQEEAAPDATVEEGEAVAVTMAVATEQEEEVEEPAASNSAADKQEIRPASSGFFDFDDLDEVGG